MHPEDTKEFPEVYRDLYCHVLDKYLNTTVPSFELAIIMEKKSYKNKLIILWHLIQIKILLDTNENFQSFQQNLGSFQIIFYFSYSISKKKFKNASWIHFSFKIMVENIGIFIKNVKDSVQNTKKNTFSWRGETIFV